jgi:hypothetical protein
VKVDSTYKLLPGVEVKDEIAKAKESVIAIFKAAGRVPSPRRQSGRLQLNCSSGIRFLMSNHI